GSLLQLMLTMVHEHCQELSRLPRPSYVHGAHIEKSDDADKAWAKIGRNVAVRYVSITVLCPRLTEQCLGFLEVGGIKALGEPAVDRREQHVGFATLALLLLQASKAHGRAQAVLRLGSAPRGNIVDRDEDALPLPVDVSKAEEAIFDQLRAGRTLGGTTGRERGSHRPCSGGRRPPPPPLRADAPRPGARRPPAPPPPRRGGGV